MTTLSICTVGQNQQDRLPEFFAAIQPLNAQLCYVDWGSDDASLRAAQGAGAKALRVEAQTPAWEARNACLDLAEGDWILWLQADEVPDALFVEAIRTAIADPNLGVACTAVRHLLPDGQAVLVHENRLFRRDPGLRHSAQSPDDLSDALLAASQKHGWQIFAAQGQIDCATLLDQIGELNDGRELLRRRWQAATLANPDDLRAWTRLLEQARLWDDSQLLADAAPQALEALERATPEALRAQACAGECLTLVAGGLYPEAHKPALLFLYPEAPREALEFLQPWEARIAPSAAFYLRLGELHELCGKEHFERAAAAFDKAVGLRTCTLKIHLATVRPLLGLARLSLGMQEARDALRLLNLALGEAPRDPEALLALTTLSRSLGGEKATQDVVAAYVTTYGDTAELHGALGEAALRSGDTQTAVAELQRAVGDQAAASPYSSLLDEALLSAL